MILISIQGMKRGHNSISKSFLVCRQNRLMTRLLNYDVKRSRTFVSSLWANINTLLLKDTFPSIRKTFESLLSVTLPTIQWLHIFQIW